MTDLSANHAERAWNALIAQNTELRRAYLTMLAERRAALVATSFSAAKTMEQLEHARGGVAVLDGLTNAHRKEANENGRRSEYADRTS